MKRAIGAINFLPWLFVVLTIIALVCTIMRTYGYSHIEYFYGYRVLQWCIFFTMTLWAIKLFSINHGKKKFTYSLICFMFAMGAIFFMYIQVW